MRGGCGGVDQVVASRWEESEFERLKEVVKEEWKREFSERLLHGPGSADNELAASTDTLRQHWKSCGLPDGEKEIG